MAMSDVQVYVSIAFPMAQIPAYVLPNIYLNAFWMQMALDARMVGITKLTGVTGVPTLSVVTIIWFQISLVIFQYISTVVLFVMKISGM